MLQRTKNKLAAGETVRVIAYGDSISTSNTFSSGDYHGGASTHDAWYGKVLERLLAQRLGSGKFVVESFGVGGHNSYEGVGRVDYLSLLRPDLVLVAFGANDAGWHVLPPEATHTALLRLVECTQYLYQSDIVMVIPGGINPLNDVWEHSEETLDAIRRVAVDRKLPCADVRAAVLAATEQGKRWAEFHHGLTDCHPTDAGHAVWAKAIFDVLVQEIAT